MTIDSITATAPRAERGIAVPDFVALPVAGRSPAAAVETVDAVKAKEATPSKQDVEDAVAKLNKSVQERGQGLEFSIDDDSKRTIVKVIDQRTKEVLRQIPTPEALQIAKSIDARKGGLLVDQQA
ncbi:MULTISPECIES: flagellar protein FlaG [unclassified Duganella]|uniref:flagellar protein FlaG n=1 Tax=unclassified Duganella TaxID=2636909 RepID=UPI0006F36CD9|nr:MULTISPECIES: flagellar protein FlaG [unclassified Duganella]KQV54256.1 flagellar biosynthesis protein FlaG [Duganella sp. Root336D2]KRC03383.1 flagellar biosynthesis protein FlaG [Duganella sp. Root198D2]